MSNSAHVISKIARDSNSRASKKEEWLLRADRILTSCYDETRHRAQGPFVEDTSKFQSLRCPRRSGKSYGMTSKALHFGEKYPGSRILIISLTLKSTKENYWTGSPGGIFAQNAEYGLGLKFNHTDLVWYHENGSRGRLAGAETKADIEYFRGAAAEADLILIDECKSFSPDLLHELIQNVLKPGLMTRDGILVMGGTPGNIPMGPFFEATYQGNLNLAGELTCVPWQGKSLKNGDGRWSLHSWTIQDNTAKQHQWRRALEDKKAAGWADDNPIWRREYLGEWVTDTTELVYSFAKYKPSGRVTWNPTLTDRENPTGLPPDEGPWRLLMGLDFGYEDDCAIVLAGWSETRQELRHFYDFKSPHMTVDDFGEEILHTISLYGQPDVIVGDKGALGKMVVETLNQRHSLGIIPAEKKDKLDHIEFLNSDFAAGRIKIVFGSDLDNELSGLQWALDKDKTLLIRTGKLREDPSCPNHLCDALLYLWRYAYHYWSSVSVQGPTEGSPEWWAEKEKQMMENYRRKQASQYNKTVDTRDTQFREIKRGSRGISLLHGVY